METKIKPEYKQVQKSKVKVLVLRAAGINCDAETVEAWQQAGAQPVLKHINEVTGTGLQKKLSGYQIITIPGGFSYGDDLGAGRLLANDLLCRLQEAFMPFVEASKPVLGICNGFQALAKSGLLGNVTLTTNQNGHFECRWVHLKVSPDSNCIFTKGIDRLYLPVAHGEGRLMVESEQALQVLEEKGQAVLRYTDEFGNTPEYPDNPNGSMGHLAGLSNETGTVFGLMPHPERFIYPLQHPRWTRLQGGEGEMREGDGLKIFRNAVEYVTQ
jgi:phosphoribosylformylglycinamidine synthase